MNSHFIRQFEPKSWSQVQMNAFEMWPLLSISIPDLSFCRIFSLKLIILLLLVPFSRDTRPVMTCWIFVTCGLLLEICQDHSTLIRNSFQHFIQTYQEGFIILDDNTDLYVLLLGPAYTEMVPFIILSRGIYLPRYCTLRYY